MQTNPLLEPEDNIFAPEKISSNIEFVQTLAGTYVGNGKLVNKTEFNEKMEMKVIKIEPCVVINLIQTSTNKHGILINTQNAFIKVFPDAKVEAQFIHPYSLADFDSNDASLNEMASGSVKQEGGAYVWHLDASEKDF